MENRKRKNYTLDQKVKFIREVDDNPHKTKTEIASGLGIAYTSLCTVISKRNAILDEFLKLGAKSTKRSRQQEGRYVDLEKALFIWFQQKRAAGLPISGDMLKAKAIDLAKTTMSITADFKASSGWLQGFKDRHGITGRNICGESKAVNDVTVQHWNKEVLPGIIRDYQSQNIYNCDETGLFYNLLPSKTLAEKGDSCHGGKKSKIRVTVLLTTNADGSDKLPPLVIGKSKNPRCFKGVKTKPTEYESNRNSWMTMILMEQWLKKLDVVMKKKQKKILLLMDRCAAHPPQIVLENVRVEFFPPNCTSVLQPLDLGIIANFKVHYRKKLVQHLITLTDAGNENLSINLLQAMEFISAAWKQVSSSTINNCFRKAGVFLEEAASDDDGDEVVSVNELALPEGADFDTFVHFDDNLAVCGELQDGEIIANVCQQRGGDQESGPASSDSDGDDDLILETPKLSEVLSAIDVCRRYISAKSCSEKALNSLMSLQNEVYTLNARKVKQAKLAYFFEAGPSSNG